jgi:hypothetical protein
MVTIQTKYLTAEWSMAKTALSNLTVYLMLRKQGVK